MFTSDVLSYPLRSHRINCGFVCQNVDMHNLDIMLVFEIVLFYYVDMYVARASWPSSNGKSYQSIHLRESYRDGAHFRKRDIANLTHCDPKEIAAIELALQFKGNLAALGSLDKVQLSQGLSLGAVWTVAETARRLGIDQALGTGFAAQLALWQVLARVLEQGSRLSAVRLAQVHAACDVLGIQRGFDENDLYANLTWLSARQRLRGIRLQPRRQEEQKTNRHRPVVRRAGRAGLDRGVSRQHPRSENLRRASQESQRALRL